MSTQPLQPSHVDAGVRPAGAIDRLDEQIARIEADLRALGVAMQADLGSVDGEQGDAITDLVTGDHVDEPTPVMIELATTWSQLSRERSILAHQAVNAQAGQPDAATHQQALQGAQGEAVQGSGDTSDSGHSRLDQALLGVAGALRQVEALRHGPPWMREAADAGAALRMLAFGVVQSAGLAPGVSADPRDHLVQAKAISDLIAPLGGNGLIDAVVWPACRRAGHHRLAEDLTATTNALRAARHALNAQESAAHTAPSPSLELQCLRESLAAARAEVLSLRSAAESMYFALNDASSVVDASDDENYAYQSEIERGADALGIDRDTGHPVSRATAPRG